MKIERPGIYFGVSDADYRADPCPTPSLTQSLCKILIERSPKHAWIAHSRLNPQFEYEDDTKFDIGNVAHRLILGRGKDIEVVHFSDWRSNAAKEARENAANVGKIAVLKHQYEQSMDMVTAAWKQLEVHDDKDAFTGGHAEVMLAWEEDGVWFRSLIDWLHDGNCMVDDFKTTSMSVAPHMLGIRAEAGGWHLQAAFIERGLNALDPGNSGRRLFRFIAQETDQPHALSVMHMNEYWLTMGRKQIDAAIGLWRPCIQHNRWPSYPRHSITPEFPGYRESKWLDREQSGEFEPDTSLIMAG